MAITAHEPMRYVTGGHEGCMELLVAEGLELISSTGCNATWDQILCWPMTHAGASAERFCPPMLGMEKSMIVQRRCHVDGFWENSVGAPDRTGNGYTPYLNFCFEVKETEMACARNVAQHARVIEYVGLVISIVTLGIACFIFANFRRLRVFRTQLHLHLMLSLLLMVFIRLSLYSDQSLHSILAPNITTVPKDAQPVMNGVILHPNAVICTMCYILLEYLKCVTFTWMYLEGFYLHNTLVFTVFNSPPTIRRYLYIAWGVPIAHVSLWLLALYVDREGQNLACLNAYYLDNTYWILEAPRMLQLLLNFFFIANVIRVLWAKVRETYAAGESDGIRKSVRAAFMLIPLLGGPTFMDTISVTPTCEWFFTIWTVCTTVLYVFQGFMIAMLYCFMNKEVMTVLKQAYDRYCLQHASGEALRRGSRGAALAQGVNPGQKPSTAQMTALNATSLRGNNNSNSTANDSSKLNAFSDKTRTGSLAMSRLLNRMTWLGGGTTTTNGDAARRSARGANRKRSRKSAPCVLQNNGALLPDESPVDKPSVEVEEEDSLSSDCHAVTMRSEGGRSFAPIDEEGELFAIDHIDVRL